MKENAEFLKILKTVSDVMVFAGDTKEFFATTKREARRKAKESIIRYYVTDQIFVIRRDTLVIL